MQNQEFCSVCGAFWLCEHIAQPKEDGMYVTTNGSRHRLNDLKKFHKINKYGQEVEPGHHIKAEMKRDSTLNARVPNSPPDYMFGPRPVSLKSGGYRGTTWPRIGWRERDKESENRSNIRGLVTEAFKKVKEITDESNLTASDYFRGHISNVAIMPTNIPSTISWSNAQLNEICEKLRVCKFSEQEIIELIEEAKNLAASTATTVLQAFDALSKSAIDYKVSTAQIFGIDIAAEGKETIVIVRQAGNGWQHVTITQQSKKPQPITDEKPAKKQKRTGPRFTGPMAWKQQRSTRTR